MGIPESEKLLVIDLYFVIEYLITSRPFEFHRLNITINCNITLKENFVSERVVENGVVLKEIGGKKSFNKDSLWGL